LMPSCAEASECHTLLDAIRSHTHSSTKRAYCSCSCSSHHRCGSGTHSPRPFLCAFRAKPEYSLGRRRSFRTEPDDLSSAARRPHCPDFLPGDQISNPDPDHRSREACCRSPVEQGAVMNASLSIEKEANSPDLFLCERTLCPYRFSSVPSCALATGIIVLGMAHVSSPRP
jgi:hypothetical protein